MKQSLPHLSILGFGNRLSPAQVSVCLRHWLGAMAAAASGQGNLAQAFWARLGGGRGFSIAFFDLGQKCVQGHNNSEISNAGDDEK
jgi:hypothetical protein